MYSDMKWKEHVICVSQYKKKKKKLFILNKLREILRLNDISIALVESVIAHGI